MTREIFGRPYGGLSLKPETMAFLEEFNLSTIIYQKPGYRSGRQVIYGFDFSLKIYEYNEEDPEDLKGYLNIALKYHAMRVMPIGEVICYIYECQDGHANIVEVFREAKSMYSALVIIGEDESIWLNDHMSVCKAANSIQEFLALPPETHWQGKYEYKYDFPFDDEKN